MVLVTELSILIQFLSQCAVYSESLVIGVSDGMVVCHLPYGPTAYFGIFNAVRPSQNYDELLIQNPGGKKVNSKKARC